MSFDAFLIDDAGSMLFNQFDDGVDCCAHFQIPLLVVVCTANAFIAEHFFENMSNDF